MRTDFNTSRMIQTKIPNGLSSKLSPKIDWQHFDRIDSTNAFLLDELQPTNQLISTDQQTAGRGRRQQKWIDEGDSALFSLSTEHVSGRNIDAWPVQVAITLATTLNQLYTHLLTTTTKPIVQIKWPNDLYVRQNDQCGKCGGILIERIISRRKSKVVTGIGLNLAPLHTNVSSDYHSGFIALPIDKKDLIVILTNQLLSAWVDFPNSPTISTDTYQKIDLLYGKKITASDSKNITTTGIANGVNSQGHLLIQQGEIVHSLTSQQRIRLSDD